MNPPVAETPTPQTDKLQRYLRTEEPPKHWYLEFANLARELERENIELRAKLSRAEGEARIKGEFLSSRQCPDHSGKWERGRCLQCELKAAESSLRERNEDAERLDWLDERRNHTQFPELGRKNIVVVQCEEGKSLREAIDAARSQS